MHKGRNSIFIIGGIIFLVLIVSALGFVLLLRPADAEYNNTIPAVMGIISIIGIAISGLLNMLSLEKKHKENITKLEHIERGENENG